MEDILRAHQMLLLSMLKELDRICRKHDIPYTLFAGTALGAVRHAGFIPWDDDLDVIMLRKDYERFLTIAEQELPAEYYLQKEFSEHWPCFFSKIRKNNTAYMEKTIPKDPLQHQGIYIDIFPCDHLSDCPIMRRVQFFASKIVIAKSLYQRGYLTNSRCKKIAMRLASLLPRKPFLYLVKLPKKENSRMVHSFFGGSAKYRKSIYPREWFESRKLMAFEDAEVFVSASVDQLLTCLYGDYMTLPPEEERICKVHAMKIDPEHSYEQYIEWQANQKIDVYTRSIR